MSYQFIHFDSYAREGSKQSKTVTKKNGDKITTTKQVKSIRQILEEQARIEAACPHIDQPRRPGLLYGVPPMEVIPMVEDWASNAKDAQGRKLRKDGLCALVGVASLPREMEDDFPQFAEDTLAWLKEKYGDRLKSVIVHDDEAHPHLHFTVVPRIGERFDDIHDGYKASKQVKQEGKKKGEQNLAYIEAMRAVQDDFSNRVAMSHGLTRIGPGRRRLTRAQWKAEKAQARFFANAKAVAKVASKQGYKDGIHKAEEKAKAIIQEAQEQAKGLGSKFGGWLAGLAGAWHKPTAEALAEVEKAKKESDKEKKKAETYAQKAKEWADQRVATVGNQITAQKEKTKELERDLEKEQEKSKGLGEVVAWYEKKFGIAPGNFNKLKK